MTLCEQCGNEYSKKPFVDRDTGKLITQCPYCKWKNPLPQNHKKKKNKDNKNM